MIFIARVISMQHSAFEELREIDSQISSSMDQLTSLIAVAKDKEESKTSLRKNTDMIKFIDKVDEQRTSLNDQTHRLSQLCNHVIKQISEQISNQLGQQFKAETLKLSEQIQELSLRLNSQPALPDGTDQSDVLNQINQQFEDLKTATNETNDYTCSNIDALSGHFEKLNKNILSLCELIRPPELNRNYIETAKYLIEHTINNQGRCIKSGSITIPNVAAILEAYDRLLQAANHK